MTSKFVRNYGWKKVLLITAMVTLLLLASVFLFWQKYFLFRYVLNPWVPPQLQFVHSAQHDVVGDLGGMMVTIPSYYASLVEYEGDPGWGAKRRGAQLERTDQSRFKSFSVDFRYPDMAGLSSPGLKADKHKANIYDTMWIDFGVTTGKSYPGDGFLDRRTSYITTSYTVLKHEKQPKLQYGLTVYAPIGADPSTRIPFRTHHEDEDVFVHYNQAGHVDAYIVCSNVRIASAPCLHTFSLEPRVKAEIYIHYRRGLLPEWKNLQGKITQLIGSWEVNPPSAQAQLKISPQTAN